YGVELSDENHLQFLIPQGFAHGFAVLSETALFSYKCDNYYQPSAERGIAYNDPTLNIDWKIDSDKAVVSEKDMKHPLFQNAEHNFNV
ncbi:MAG: dTDP-4-dehydrorhamnose 3,5-epimerase, partial [Prevotellaceae bacterium]|nr:dTDP-4-dehydrorhamnose 3,5-epimerase [Prevotellaceae bacterium]